MLWRRPRCPRFETLTAGFCVTLFILSVFSVMEGQLTARAGLYTVAPEDIDALKSFLFVNVSSSVWTKDSILWSDYAESAVPRGNTKEDIAAFKAKVSSLHVQSANDEKCKSNMLWNHHLQLTFSDGTLGCARLQLGIEYSFNELVSYHLSTLIGLDNVPIVHLMQYRNNSTQWGNITRETLYDGRVMPVVQWLGNISNRKDGFKMPIIFKEAFFNETPVSIEILEKGSHSTSEIAAYVQYTDMLVFDYIIGILDRILQNTVLERKSGGIHKSIRNVAKIIGSDKIWLYDNELSLLKAYSYIYNYTKARVPPQYNHAQEDVNKMLRTSCVFRERTLRNVAVLASEPFPLAYVLKHIRSVDPLYDKFIEQLKIHSTWIMPFEADAFLKERLQFVLRWAEFCRMKIFKTWEG